MDKPHAEDQAGQAPRTDDDERLVDLAKAPDDADDTSDASEPTTDHDDSGWRSDSPSKP